LIAQFIGWITFVFGASALFSALQDALNAVWAVEGTQGVWKHMLRERLASLGMVAVVGFLLLISFGLNAAVNDFANPFRLSNSLRWRCVAPHRSHLASLARNRDSRLRADL
jgi:membrane protein